MSQPDECGEPLGSRDGLCDRTPSMPDGKCKYHSEVETGVDQDWKPNYKHGLYMDRGGYYEEQPDETQKWLDAVADDLLQKSKFGREDISAMEKCRQVAIDLHQRRRADSYIQEHGMTQTNQVGFHEQYGVLEEENENTLFVAKDRLSRETRMTMKDLGIFEDNDEKTEEAAESLIESLSEDLDE